MQLLYCKMPFYSKLMLEMAHLKLILRLCPRVQHRNRQKFRDDQPAILRYLPFNETAFKLVTRYLHVHRAITVLLRGRSPAWCSIPCKIVNVPGRGKLNLQTLIALTFSPTLLAPPCPGLPILM